MKLDTIAARIRAARQAAGFKTARSALLKLDIPPSTYSQYETGSRVPDETILMQLAKKFKVRLEWLKTGVGNPFPKDNPKLQQIIDESLEDNTLIKTAGKPVIDAKVFVKIAEKLIQLNKTTMHKKPFVKIIHDTIEIYNELVTIQVN
jgi:transcriptional regulator with XRE-family HTH domain